MYHHSIALTLAEGRVADLQSAAAYSGPTASPPHRHRRRLGALALGLAAIAALAPTGALAQPTHDAGTSTNERPAAVARDHHPRMAPGTITFPNPLARSRGPGTGAGLL